MRKMIFFGFMSVILSLWSCKKQTADEFRNYVFVNAYCTTVTVGGVVGLAEKCFNLGDVVKGQQTKDGVITIRIAEHSAANDGAPGPHTYQELLDVPSAHLKLN